MSYSAYTQERTTRVTVGVKRTSESIIMPGLFDEVACRFEPTTRTPSPQPSTVDLMMATSKAIDLLEGRPIRHGLKIAAIAGTIAQTMGLSQRETTALLYASLLHDVGLVKITADLSTHLPTGMTEKELFYSHAMLNARIVSMTQDRRISDTAQTLLAAHPMASADFIDAAHLSADIKEIIATHHELADGSGYPIGLSGDQIPLGGRILAFADTLEAVMQEVSGLTTRKSAIESFLDIKAINKFDPDVVKAFRAIASKEDMLRQLFSLEVEDAVRAMFPQSASPLSGTVFLDTVRAMSQLADRLLPKYTRNHSEKVAFYAHKIANHLGVNRTQVGELMVASLLHDIGKLGVPLSILTKACGLSDEENALLEQHPHFTEEILKGIPGFDNVIEWAAEHHEWMNGRGFPARKKGFEISLGARIIAVADAFDVLTSPRPDRLDPIEPMDALPILGQGRYRCYDNQIVSILRTVILEREIVLF